MQISTSISDGVLAIATAWAVWRLLRARHAGAALCMAIIAAAASLGSMRFAGVIELVDAHAQLSHYAALVAFPVFGWLLLRTQMRGGVVSIWEFLVATVLFTALSLWSGVDRYASWLGATGLGCALIAALASIRRDRVSFLLIGWSVALYAAAGLWVGTDGMLGPTLRVDAYHYLLAIANPMLVLALLRFDDHRH